MDITMNDATKTFIDELKTRPDVLGIILFGSWARGNQRPHSDVDLIVILSEGYRRAIEEKKGQVFEIIYTTGKYAWEYWDSHKDDAANLWQAAKIVYDKDGTVERLQAKTQQMLADGKKHIDKYQLGQLRFDAEYQIEYAESISQVDITTANMILNNKIFNLTELFFDIRQQWIPAPKQRLEEIKRQNNQLQSLLDQFYGFEVTFEQKLLIAKQITPIVFGETDKTG